MPGDNIPESWAASLGISLITQPRLLRRPLLHHAAGHDQAQGISVGFVQRIWRRHGTTTLFAALNVLDGKVVGHCMQKHRHQEYIRFLNAVEATMPSGKHVHAIVDNYATHKLLKVREWLDAHPWRTFHFTPTSASWLNAVEGFFAKLTKQRLVRGVFRSVDELKDAIGRFLAENNQNARSFQWTKKPNEILAAVKRGHQMLDSIH